MGRNTIADKLAEKTFHSEAIQKSWRVHMQAFGPILEPAFAGDFQSRIHVTAALNRISRGDVQGGFDKLKALQSACETDADKAAWLFFVGVCYEMSGMKQEMVEFYQRAGLAGHEFYLPYLKVAKAAHEAGALEDAQENYHAAISRLEKGEQTAQTRMILAAAKKNLAACVELMHSAGGEE